MATESVAAQPLRVVLVEDDAFDAELTLQYLRRARPDCRCTVVADERAFVEALQSHDDVDLVLSDFSLPQFSGNEALALTRRLRPELPFIFVSGVLGEEHVVDMLKQGATDYVVKVRMERLPLVVDRAMAEVAERSRREATERKLRESETLYGRLVESLQDHAVVLLAPDGTVRSWNEAAHRLFGYAPDEIRGRSAAVLYGPDADARAAFQERLARAAADGKALDDRWLVRRDGSGFYSSGVYTALRDADGSSSGFSMVARDVTESIRAAQALEAAKNEAEQANRAKDRFLAVLSHELRTPLTPLLATAHLLERRADLPAQVAQLVPMIRRNVELEARLIDDLLDLTSIERGKLALQSAPVDLHATLESALAMSAADIEGKQLDLRLQLQAERARTIGDDARLQQVYWNLIRNAVKFTPAGGRIVIRTRNEGEHFVAEVADEGIGIAPEALPRIFNLFEQANVEGTRYGGLGIGLSIARGLAQHHGGTLSAGSDGLGHGATFTLRLPLAAVQAEAGNDTAPAAAPPAAAPAVPSCAVLLVEDHADVAESVRTMLEETGHRVRVAASLREAREALRAGRFDLLVCDLGLPDGHGSTVLSFTDGRVPAIAISGYGMDADIRESRAAGFKAHIVKPFNPAQLHAALATLTRSD